MNLSDSERVKSIVENMGISYTPKEEEADLLGIISCSVRQKPIDKVYSRIHKWNKQKNRKNLITFVSGCVLPEDKKKFLKLFDIVFDMSELNDFPDMLMQYGIVTPLLLSPSLEKEKAPSVKFDTQSKKSLQIHKNKVAPLADFDKVNKKLVVNQNPFAFKQNSNIFHLWEVKPNYQSEFEAYVPIQNGCNKFCTYCAVPFTRGREVSRPSKEIVAEVKRLIENNYKSITLLGQNVNSYGLDNKNEINFAQLLEEIGKVGNTLNKKCWVYFTAPHPLDMTRDVVEAISKYKILGKQIHLPLQSGSNEVLKRMNRKHDVNKYRESISYIRELIPQATLFTDIIVGFSGETEEQFVQTIKSFEEFKYNMAYIAMYSPRPGARSFEWEDDVSKEVKKQRYQRLTECLEKISFEYNKTLINKEMDVLVRTNERKTGFLSGHNEGKIVTRILSKNTSLIGQIIRVKITEVGAFSITGELVEENKKIKATKNIEKVTTANFSVM